ncbi:MAG: bifunctional DNA-formamidopyrimidine glycosylase/DNA-(apurinic or apyrimidinic site) lyase [Peptococcaceae bacterium]|nr:bifunctional DNA-formamidopyrimidine glycosylase/DNA-(apurinic or apyrimidinic site) lyase [Peptococcaceae bacterium]
MPELPEVETVRQSLQKKVAGLKIAAVKIVQPKVVKAGPFEDFAVALLGRTFIDFERRGKYLLAHLDGSASIVVHLRMTGRWVYCKPDTQLAKHTHVIFQLSDGNELRFTDTRRFGGMELVATQNLVEYNSLLKLGVEPLSEDFTPEILCILLQGKKSKIKSLILDQTNLAGLGNIYADEALFLAGIHPERKAETITAAEALKLHHAIQEVLQKGIANKGTTFRDYVDAEGQQGQNQLSLNVYGRGGQNCVKCGTALGKAKVGGRTSIFCPACQPTE